MYTATCWGLDTEVTSREAWGPEGIQTSALDDTGDDKALGGDKPGENN